MHLYFGESPAFPIVHSSCPSLVILTAVELMIVEPSSAISLHS